MKTLMINMKCEGCEPEGNEGHKPHSTPIMFVALVTGAEDIRDIQGMQIAAMICGYQSGVIDVPAEKAVEMSKEILQCILRATGQEGKEDNDSWIPKELSLPASPGS